MREIGRNKIYSVLDTSPLRCSLMYVYDTFQTTETFTVDGHRYTHTLTHTTTHTHTHTRTHTHTHTE